MDPKQTNQLIGYTVLVILAYYVLQLVIPYLLYAMAGLVIWRVYQEYRDHHK